MRVAESPKGSVRTQSIRIRDHVHRKDSVGGSAGVDWIGTHLLHVLLPGDFQVPLLRRHLRHYHQKKFYKKNSCSLFLLRCFCA